MAAVIKTKVKGCKKCGRGKKRSANKGNPISSFVRGKMTGEDYFKATGQSVKR